MIAVRHDDAGGTLDLRRLHELDVDLLETSSAPPGSAAELMALLRCLRRLLESARFDWLVFVCPDRARMPLEIIGRFA